MNTPAAPPECGGILGGKDGIVNRVASDTGGVNEYDFYIPDVSAMNEIISEWKLEDVEFMGIYHTHFAGGEELSFGDIKYIEKIMAAMPDEYILYFPLILPEKITGYRADNIDGSVHIFSDDIQIIP